MKLTVEIIDEIKLPENYVLFRNGIAHRIIRINPIIKAISEGRRYYPWIEYLSELTPNCQYDIFPASEIKMPVDLTALKESEGSKSKTCLDWFNECPDTKLRAALLAEMDGDHARDRKAINMLDAIEQGIFFEDNENAVIIRAEVARLKSPAHV